MKKPGQFGMQPLTCWNYLGAAIQLTEGVDSTAVRELWCSVLRYEKALQEIFEACEQAMTFDGFSDRILRIAEGALNAS